MVSQNAPGVGIGDGRTNPEHESESHCIMNGVAEGHTIEVLPPGLGLVVLLLLLVRERLDRVVVPVLERRDSVVVVVLWPLVVETVTVAAVEDDTDGDDPSGQQSPGGMAQATHIIAGGMSRQGIKGGPPPPPPPGGPPSPSPSPERLAVDTGRREDDELVVVVVVVELWTLRQSAHVPSSSHSLSATQGSPLLEESHCRSGQSASSTAVAALRPGRHRPGLPAQGVANAVVVVRAGNPDLTVMAGSWIVAGGGTSEMLTVCAIPSLAKKTTGLYDGVANKVACVMIGFAVVNDDNDVIEAESARARIAVE